MTAPIPALPPTSPAVSATGTGKAGAGEAFTFGDLVSIVNPLQHIPIVSTVYRAVTGETIKPLERIIGDTLYGGIPGFMSGVANVVFEDVTGKDIGATALALLNGDDDTKNLASTQTPTETADASASGGNTLLFAGVANGPPRPLMPQAAQPVVDAPAPPTIVASATPSAASRTETASDQPVADGPPRALQPQEASDAGSAALALLGAMNAQGIDADLSQRALAAYQRSLSVAPGDSITVH